MIKEVKGFQVEGRDTTIYDTKKQAEEAEKWLKKSDRYTELRDGLSVDFPGVVKYIKAGFNSDHIAPMIEEYIEVRKELTWENNKGYE